jgi:hypothetical protein
MEVHLVTSGEYSDYRIEGVYLGRALAEQHAGLLGDTAGIDTRTVETGPAARVTRWVRYYRIQTGADDIYEHPEVLPASGVSPMPRPAVYADSRNLVVEGYDRAAVDKVYSERKAKLSAAAAGEA